MSMWVTGISAAVSVGSQIYNASNARVATNKAADTAAGAAAAHQALVANLKYEPIDIAKLQADATQGAIDNATRSLALERSLTPDVAALRSTTDAAHLAAAKQVSARLALGGNLDADTVNQVENAGRVIGSKSGIGSGSTVPLTAGLLGLNSIDLQNQRANAALGLQGPGASPKVGLDPGSLASAEVAQNAANNQFNLAKAGVDSNLIDSQAKASAAQIAGQSGNNASTSGLLAGTFGTGGTAAGLLSAYKKAYPSPNTVSTDELGA